MKTVEISVDRAPSPGDVRHYGDGVTLELRGSARERPDWPSLVCAFSTAVARGADVVWRG